MASIAIVGAGLAGVSAARALAAEGLPVSVFDRGRAPGGRSSSRSSPAGTFDHGAQYFTARNARFMRVVQSLEQRGLVQPWQGRLVRLTDAGAVECGNDGSRYVGVPDMRALVRGVAGTLDITSATRIARAHPSAHGWALVDETGFELGKYEALLLATPAEQARPLVPRSSPLYAALCNARSAPCWALMLAFDSDLALDFDAAFVDHPDIAWIARDSSKPGRAPGERWVVHATPAWSAARHAVSADEVADALTASFFAVTAITPTLPRHADAHRWALARPIVASPCGSLWDDDLRLALCGDWCMGPRLEDAYLSGLAAARQLADEFLPRRRSGAA
jgi:renalase